MTDQTPNDDERPQTAGDPATFGWHPPQAQEPLASWYPQQPPPQQPPQEPQPQQYPAQQYPPQYGSTILPGGAVPPGAHRPELLSAGQRGSGEHPKRGLAAIVLTLVAVIAVIVGGVVYVGRHKSTSAAGQPDQWAPANSVAYLKLNLDPSSTAASNALKFEQTFPDAPKASDPADLQNALLAAALDPPGSDVDYTTDIKPWLGSKAALAVYPDASGGVVAVGIVQVTDAAKAKAGLAKLAKLDGTAADGSATASSGPQSAAPDDTIVAGGSNTPVGYTVEGDYAVIGQSQAIVDAAIAAAQKSNLGTNATYSADIATLKGSPILTGWADLGALAKLGQSLDAESPLAGELGGLDSLKTGSIKGRAVLGLQVEPTYADIQGTILGTDVSIYKNGSAGTTLGELPASTVGGIAVSGLSDDLQTELTALEKVPLVATAAQAKFDSISSELGIAIPADALNLLGNEFAIGLDNVPTGQNPNSDDPGGVKLTVLTEPGDATRALATAKVLTGLAGKAGMTLSATTRGQQIVVTNDPDASGSLGDDPGFKAALAGMPSQVLAAEYVNIAAISSGVPASASATEPADVKHLGSIGTYSGIEGNTVVFGMRLTLQ